MPYELIIFFGLLALGYGFGSMRERAHYKSIREREKKYQNIFVFEHRLIDDEELRAKSHGAKLVQGNVVISSDYFKMVVAGLRKLIGGRLKSYESLLDRGRREAILRMKQAAAEQGATHVVNVRLETSSISQGRENAIGSIEVLAYGSALTVKP